jgi:DNA repair protein RecO (recombination protein O)
MPGRPPRVTKSRAIVLRHRRLGDADRIITFLTENRGKVDAVAKGVLRPRSKLAGHLEPVMHVEVLLAHGRNLDIVTQAQTVEGFPDLHDDLELLTTAIYFTELADRFTVERADARALYELLHASLVRLARGDGLQLVTRRFELELLHETGFRPQWRDCIGCGRVVDEGETAWSPLGGGVVCDECRAGHADARMIETTTLKVLRAYQESLYEEAARIRLTPELAANLERVMHQLMESVAERELKSQHFVTEARRAGAANTTAGEEPARA